MKIRTHHRLFVLWNRLRALATGKSIQIVIVMPLLIIITMIIAIVYLYPHLPPEIPLYYSRPWGVDQLARPIFLLLLPLGSLFWYILTLIISSTSMYQFRVFAQLLLIFSFVVTVLSGWELLNIFLLVL